MNPEPNNTNLESSEVKLLDRYQNVLFIALVAAIIAGGLLLATSRPAPVHIIIAPPDPTATPGPIQVYVSGAVAQPAVYALSWDARVEDAIEAAGGVLESAELARINLAQRLQDGDQIHVPDATTAATQPAAAAPGGPVNINTAGPAELETLPRIGPSLAQRIIDHREAHGPFQTIEDIMEVSGIGESTFEQLRELIVVE